MARRRIPSLDIEEAAINSANETPVSNENNKSTCYYYGYWYWLIFILILFILLGGFHHRYY